MFSGLPYPGAGLPPFQLPSPFHFHHPHPLPLLPGPADFPFAPGLAHEKKEYFCQKCENHKRRNRRKNHKNDCEFR